MLARFAPCHRMGGYFSFKSCGLLFPRLTKQHPFTRLTHPLRLRVFNEAHRGIQMLKWLQSARARRISRHTNVGDLSKSSRRKQGGALPAITSWCF